MIELLNGMVVFGRGDRTPYPIIPDGATLAIGPGPWIMIASLTRPLASEVKALRRAPLDVAVLREGTTAIVVWRFGRDLFLETPFHMGLLPTQRRYVDQRSGTQVRAVTIVAQDQRGICHGLRFTSLTPAVSDAIDQIIAEQIGEAASVSWSRRKHDSEAEAFFRRWEDPSQAFAFAKSCGAMH
ncbi:hypothetical protein [Microvirga massiliensis]|uniref:hypothetical protein n=1 Tax=Microvirga massiliensis TaxID=1033741 RepID=UPI00062B5E1B|nr:hypothetical protein [Microvirga massiliensis]